MVKVDYCDSCELDFSSERKRYYDDDICEDCAQDAWERWEEAKNQW